MTNNRWPGRCLAAVLALAPAAALAQTRFEAPNGVAAGSITNSPITIYNRDPEEIQRSARQLDRSEEDRKAAEAKAADLARQLDLSNVTAQTVMGFLRVLSHQPELRLDQVPAKMAEITANYLQMQERLAALSPQDPGAADLAKQALEAGRAGQFEAADRLLEQAEAREIASVDEHRRKAAALRAARGDNAATQLHYADAAGHYEAAAEELPASSYYERGFYLSLAGDEWQTFGRSAAALGDYRASRYLFDRLVQSDPGNAVWQRDLSVSFNKVGDVLVAQGNLPEALKSYRDSLAIADRLARSDPGNAGWQRDLAVSLGRVARVQARQGAHATALAAFRQGRDIIAGLLRQSPDNAALPNDLAWFDRSIAAIDTNRRKA
jgi:tetratricopeptide (TPR) repeat protein